MNRGGGRGGGTGGSAIVKRDEVECENFIRKCQ